LLDKIPTSPLWLVCVLTGSSALFFGILLLCLVEIPYWQLALAWLSVSVCAFIVNYYLLNRILFKRLREVYNRLIAFARRRTNTGNEVEQAVPADVVVAITRAILQISGTIRKELQQMRELELVRQEYIGDISHELKTPIFAIEGYLETLLDGALQDKNVNKKFIKQALKNVQRLNGLVQDLLTITQLEAGQLKMKPEPFRLYELVLDVFEVFESKKTNTFKVFAPNGYESIIVWADKERIQQVLENLVSNAIKYGKPNGNISVRITGAGATKVLVTVEDEGTGIASEHLPHLFERFYRVEKSRSRENGGTGLGLSIVKSLLAAHDEQVSVQSDEGQGTIFSFTLERYVEGQARSGDI